MCPGTWTPERIGRSGVPVWRVDARSPRYVKAVSEDGPAGADVLIAELHGAAERGEWLRAKGFPCAEVVDVGAREGWHYLVTAAVAGRTLAEAWPAGRRRAVIAGLAEFTRALHAIPVSDCPFRRDLNIMIPAAIAAVEAGAVDEDDFDDERRGLAAGQVLAELLGTRPASEDLVVCHGDLCLPNVLADPATGRITGVVDLGRLGVADRHQDLALATRSLGPVNDQYGPEAPADFLVAYGIPADPAMTEFYRLLDEFF
jgi:kanamycin kinase/aminoglycoside 3'-phosphotransferase-2